MFVLHILEKANERLDRRYELASRGWNETKVDARVANIYGIAADEMFRKGQRRKVAEARGIILPLVPAGAWAAGDGACQDARSRRSQWSMPPGSVSRLPLTMIF